MHRALVWAWVSGTTTFPAVTGLAGYGTFPMWWYVLGATLAVILILAAHAAVRNDLASRE